MRYSINDSQHGWHLAVDECDQVVSSKGNGWMLAFVSQLKVTLITPNYCLNESVAFSEELGTSGSFYTVIS